MSSRRRRQFEAHLAECAECRREFELFGLASRLLGEGQEGRISADFTDRLIGRLREEREEMRVSSRFVRHLRLALGAAALLLLFLWGDRMHILSELRDEYGDLFGYREQVEQWTH